MSNYIRFDWAMKRLLRDKANFAVLEGLMTTLMKKKIIIKRLLESESNQESEYDKYNRVDLLAEDETGELLLFEIQNNNEYAYFQRMLFGTSKLVTEYIIYFLCRQKVTKNSPPGLHKKQFPTGNFITRFAQTIKFLIRRERFL